MAPLIKQSAFCWLDLINPNGLSLSKKKWAVDMWNRSWCLLGRSSHAQIIVIFFWYKVWKESRVYFHDAAKRYRETFVDGHSIYLSFTACIVWCTDNGPPFLSMVIMPQSRNLSLRMVRMMFAQCCRLRTDGPSAWCMWHTRDTGPIFFLVWAIAKKPRGAQTKEFWLTPSDCWTVEPDN